MGAESFKLAEIGALVGDPTRASILTELMGGRALTAGELAVAAKITPQTITAHLTKLAAARLIRTERQGRHRYVAIASAEVARMLEAMLYLTGSDARPASRVKAPRVHGEMKRARFCYDHLAGELGVALCDALRGSGYVELERDAAQLTAAGMEFCESFGVSLPVGSKRPLCKTCLDWSERRPHLAGQFGAALAQRLIDRKWIARAATGRVVTITLAGARNLRDKLGIALEPSTG